MLNAYTKVSKIQIARYRKFQEQHRERLATAMLNTSKGKQEMRGLCRVQSSSHPHSGISDRTLVHRYCLTRTTVSFLENFTGAVPRTD